MEASLYARIKFDTETPRFLLGRLRAYAETSNKRVKTVHVKDFFGASSRDTAAYPDYLKTLGLGEAFDKNVIELDIYACIIYLKEKGIDAYKEIPNLSKMLRASKAMKNRVERNIAKSAYSGNP